MNYVLLSYPIGYIYTYIFNKICHLYYTGYNTILLLFHYVCHQSLVINL